MIKYFKEPLVQFALGGALLYAALYFFAPAEDSEANAFLIEVNEQQLLTYLQYQDKAFDAVQAERILAGIDTAARKQLENEYIRDEIMVREAIALGLEQNDDVINQRLIQKMDFIFQGFSDQNTDVSEAEITAYYDQHKANYTDDAEATFTHVFLSTDEKDTKDVSREAVTLLKTLNDNNIPFEEAGRYGDRFYFLKNYVNRPERMIKDHFSAALSAEIFTTTNLNTWIGPLQSEYGLHLVMVRGTKPTRTLPLTEIAAQITDDILRERRDTARRLAFEKAAQKYTVTYADGA